MNKGSSTQSGSCQDRATIAFIEICTHTSHITYVVTYIIGNRCRVTRVIFGNTGLNLTYQVGAYIGSFRINTSTYTGKERLCGSTHSKSKHGGSDNAEFMSRSQNIFRYNRIQ